MENRARQSCEKRNGGCHQLCGRRTAPILRFSEVVKYAKKNGLSLSLITNGSLIKNGVFFPKDLFPLFDRIGFSIDNLNEKTLFNIGRRDANNKVMGKEEIIGILNYAKEQNLTKLSYIWMNLSDSLTTTHIENRLVDTEAGDFCSRHLSPALSFSIRNIPWIRRNTTTDTKKLLKTELFSSAKRG